VLGIADQAIIQTRWAAVKGQGATRNGQVIQTAAHTDINRMRLAITNPTRMTGALRQMHDALANKVEFVQYGGNMMNFARIADGCVHASFETGQHIFDVAPFVTIIGEAGGKITEIDGTPLSLNMKSNHVLAASTQQLHQHLLELYQSF
jgi:histidinol-phosphatase